MDAYRFKACGISISVRDLDESVPALMIDDLMLIDQASAKQGSKLRQKRQRRG